MDKLDAFDISAMKGVSSDLADEKRLVLTMVAELFGDPAGKRAPITVSIVSKGEPSIGYADGGAKINLILTESMTSVDAAMLAGVALGEAFPSHVKSMLYAEISGAAATSMMNARWALIESSLSSLSDAIVEASDHSEKVILALNQVLGRGVEAIPDGIPELNLLVSRVVKIFKSETGSVLNEDAIACLTGQLGMRSDLFKKMSEVNRGEPLMVPQAFLSRLMAAEVLRGTRSSNVDAFAIAGILAKKVEDETGDHGNVGRQWMPSEEEMGVLDSKLGTISVNKIAKNKRNSGVI